MADGLTLETALPPEGTAAVEALGPAEALVAVDGSEPGPDRTGCRRGRRRRAGAGVPGTENGGPLRRRRIAGRHVRGRCPTSRGRVGGARRQRTHRRPSRSGPGRRGSPGRCATRGRARLERRRRGTGQHGGRVGGAAARARPQRRRRLRLARLQPGAHRRDAHDESPGSPHPIPLRQATPGSARGMRRRLGGAPRRSAADGGVGRRADGPGRGDAAPRPGPRGPARVDRGPSRPQATRPRRGARRSGPYPRATPSGPSSASWSVTPRSGRTCAEALPVLAARPAWIRRRRRLGTSGPTGWFARSTSA